VVWLIGTKLVRDDWEVHNALGGPIQFTAGRTRAIRSDNTGDVAFTAAGWPSLPTKTQRCPSTGSVTATTAKSRLSSSIVLRSFKLGCVLLLPDSMKALFAEGHGVRRVRAEVASSELSCNLRLQIFAS